MRFAVLAVVVALTACGSHHAPRARPPIQPAEWKAVLNDWYPDSVVDHAHPCAAIVIARAHLPSPTLAYSTVDRDLQRAEQRWCPRSSSLDALKMGMSDADVAAVAGVPDTVGPKCWLYVVTRDHDGRRVCFARGRVTILQFSVHG
jgi:hypothetical protein